MAQRLPWWCSLVLVVTLTEAAFGQDAASEGWRAGAAQVDITPEYPIRLNGFGGRREEAVGITQRIYAKALAIQDATGGPAVLLTVDSLGLRWPMVEQLAEHLRKQFGIPRERIVVTFTHSHTTPKVNGASDTIFSAPIPPDHQAHIDRYTQQLANWLLEAAVQALGDMQPAQVHWAVGRVGFARNRRTPGGPVDHQLPTLFVRSPEGRVRAVYATYACHCVTLSNNQLSGDWAGYAQQWLARKFPGAIGMISIGAGSDANPDSGVMGDRVDLASAQGAQIADEIQRLSNGPLEPVPGPLEAQLRLIGLPLEDPPGQKQLQQLAAAGGPNGYNAQFQLARVQRGESLQTQIDYPVQTWRFGDACGMVFLAGEVCVDYALRLRRELSTDKLWIHGYSNDFCAYIPSERLLQEGGYGGGAEICYFALPNRFQPGLEQKIVTEVRRQLPENWVAPAGTQGVPPKTPLESLRRMHVAPEYRVELAAAEPLVMDPVAIDFAPDGSLWVVEMADYARPVDGTFPPGGRVKRLIDDDHDGTFDRAELFSTGLRFPTDVKIWRAGVLVCDAPSILYLEDQDGDGRADVRKPLFRGFATHNPHARVNSLRWGMDGWVYGSGGLFGGQISNPHGDLVDVRDRDFRILPDTMLIEPETGRTQQGRDRDTWGNWYGCNNSQLVLHYPILDEYLRRNPVVQAPPTVVDIQRSPQAGQLYPPEDLVRFKLSGPPGRATSACGLSVYQDNWLGEALLDNVFVCEPVNQLVHREVLRREGGLMTAQRAPQEQKSEFLISRDQWFRPVQTRTGPDGSLWIVDMYRYVIEHPQWIPEETRAELNVMAGADRGRIYRVVRTDRPPRITRRLDTLSNLELAESLDTENGVTRDLAQQLLYWRKAQDAADAVRRVAESSRIPAARMQALYALHTLAMLSDSDLLRAMSDTSAGVRRHAIRLAALGLRNTQDLLQRRLAELADPAPEVRAEAAWSLAATEADSAAALAAMVHRDAADPYLAVAALAAIRPSQGRTFLAAADAWLDQLPQEVLTQIFAAVTAGETDQLATLLDWICEQAQGDPQPPWTWRALDSVLTAWPRHDSLNVPMPPSLQQRLRQAMQDCARYAEAARGATPDSLAAVRLLGNPWDRNPERCEALIACLHPDRSLELQTAALEALTRLGEPAAGSALIERLSQASPAMQPRMLDALLARDAWSRLLAEAILAGQMNWNQLDPARRLRLLEAQDSAHRTALLQLEPNGIDQPRESIVTEYTRALKTAEADPQAPVLGQALFNKHCAACHRVGQLGNAVGPDLAALTVHQPSWWLTAVLNPNRDVDQRYMSYQVRLQDGRSYSGLLAEENSNGLVLVQQDGKQLNLARSQIDQLRRSDRSFMPEGFEKQMTPQETSSLLAFLLREAPQAKSLAGNTPQVVQPNADGAYVLDASTAEILGGDITFEAALGNIGYWHGQNDVVRWKLEAPTRQRMDVFAEWACDAGSAGNTFQIDGLDRPLVGAVEATGSWSAYRRAAIGQAILEPGSPVIMVRPAGPLRGALWDLKRIELIPTK